MSAQAQTEWPANSIVHFDVGSKNFYAVSFMSGLVRIYRADNGTPLCELAAHSR